MNNKNTFIIKLSISIVLLILAIYFTLFIIEKSEKYENDIRAQKIDAIKYRIEELNKDDTYYNERGNSLLKEDKPLFSQNYSIGEKIGYFEISMERAKEAEDNFILGKKNQYDIYNLSYDAYKIGAINEDKFKSVKNIIEINIVYYNTRKSIAEYKIKSLNEFIIGYRLMKDMPQEQQDSLLDIIDIGISAYTGNSDTISKTIDLIKSSSSEHKNDEEIKIRFTKGTEYWKTYSDSDLPYFMYDKENKYNIWKTSNDLLPGCDIGKCDLNTMIGFNKNLGFVYEETMCKVLGWGLEEECNYIKIRTEEIDKCLKDSTCSTEDAAEKIKERRIFAENLVPPRKIGI